MLLITTHSCFLKKDTGSLQKTRTKISAFKNELMVNATKCAVQHATYCTCHPSSGNDVISIGCFNMQHFSFEVLPCSEALT